MNKDSTDFPEGERLDGSAPERRDILSLLEDQGRPLKRREIVERLRVTGDISREILRRRPKAMVRDGQLIKNRRGAYGLPARMDLIPGRVSAHRDGYGFVIPDDGDSDLYLSPRQMRRVLHGDRVLARREMLRARDPARIHHLPGREVAVADVADLALAHEIVQGPECLL